MIDYIRYVTLIYNTHMSQKTLKQYTPNFKFRLAFEAAQEKTSLSELSRKYGVAHSLLSKWKSHLLKHGNHIFETNPDKEKETLKKKMESLEQMIGKKEVELNLLKNFSDFYQSQSSP